MLDRQILMWHIAESGVISKIWAISFEVISGETIINQGEQQKEPRTATVGWPT